MHNTSMNKLLTITYKTVMTTMDNKSFRWIM